MKKIFNILIIVSCTLFCIIPTNRAKANSQMNVQWVTVLNDGHTYEVELQVAVPTSGSTHYLQGADFYFEVDQTSLSYSSFSGNVVSAFSTGGGYGPSTATGFGAGSGFDGGNYAEYDIEVSPNGTFTGANIAGGSWFTVATLSWTITSSSGNTTINWDQSNLGASGSNNVTNSVYETSSTNYQEGTTPWASFNVNPLPIILTNFFAFINDNVAQINWTTAQEINNDYFTVQRSQDGIHFNDILTKDGAGTSLTPINYVAYDENPLSGTSYYRLKQTDFNGASQTFYMVAVNNQVMGTFSIESVSPTNFGDNTTLYYKMPAEAATRLVVTDMRGRIVRDEQIASSGGDNKYELDNASGWSPGMYIATMYYDGRSSYIKMVKN